MYRLVIKAPK